MTGIIKYRGQMFAEVSQEMKRDQYFDLYMSVTLGREEVKVALQRVYLHYTSGDLPDDEIRDLIEKGILFGDLRTRTSARLT